MKRPFEVGERVAVYESAIGRKGTVTEVDWPKRICVGLDSYPEGDNEYWFHPKQCRRLVKKKPQVFWVDPTFLKKEKPEVGAVMYEYVQVKLVKEGK